MEAQSLFMCVFSALLYGFSSFLITVVNKVVLTSYRQRHSPLFAVFGNVNGGVVLGIFRFPSFQFLALCQLLFGIILLGTGKCLKIISFPDFDRTLPRRVWPLPLIFLLNVTFGLGGTQKLSLPMFTVLRRFSIIFTMIAEFWILGIKASIKIQLCIYLMVIGAVIAGIFDLAFDLVGYIFVFLSNAFTAAYGVYTKQKLDAKDLGESGLIFYNSFFTFVPCFVIAACSGDVVPVVRYPAWGNIWFLCLFILASVMGFVLTFSIIFCTKHNSALTTTVIGVLKNLLLTYLGMFIGGDYVFSWANFAGLNISAVGSIFYTFLAFRSKTSIAPVPPCNSDTGEIESGRQNSQLPLKK